MKRNRFKQTDSLQDRLTKFAEDMKKQAEAMPAGKEREEFLKRARSADTAAHISDWASSPGLRPPT